MSKDIIIAMVCKNESQYIEEFIDYHLALGFDRIIIGDNNDVDGERYELQLKRYIDKGQVLIIDLRGKQGIQKIFYNALKPYYGIDYEWCAFIDTDEFITFAEHSYFKNIKDFLHCRPNVKAYKLNWMIYGDNNEIYKREGKVVDRFTEPVPKDFCFHYSFPENNHVKSILRYDVDVNFVSNPHAIETKIEYYSPMGKMHNNSPFNPDLEYDCLYVRHYYTKSLEEWVNNKMGRSYADYLRSDTIKYYPLDDFFTYNKYTEEKKKFLEEKGIEYDDSKKQVKKYM